MDLCNPFKIPTAAHHDVRELKCTHTGGGSNQGKLRTRMDICVNIEPQKNIYLLWEIFLDVRELFSGEVQLGDPLSESQF